MVIARTTETAAAIAAGAQIAAAAAAAVATRDQAIEEEVAREIGARSQDPAHRNRRDRERRHRGTSEEPEWVEDRTRR